MDCRNKSRANTPPRAGTGCRFFKLKTVDAPHPTTTHSLEDEVLPFSLVPIHSFTHLSIYSFIHLSIHPLVSLFTSIYCMADPVPGAGIQLWLSWTQAPLHGVYNLGQNQPSVGSVTKSWSISRTQRRGLSQSEAGPPHVGGDNQPPNQALGG